MVVEFFDIGLDSIRATWWRKPNIKKLIELKEIVIRKDIKNKIGIDEKIIENIIKLFNEFGYNNIINGKEKDLSKISLKIELPMILVKIILTKKGILK